MPILYDALDWLLARQRRIEKKLSDRHLASGSLVLYEVTSSYYEGCTCPLARFGHDRDGEKGKSIVVYRTLTDGEGRPVAVSVYPGNTGDPTTIPDQVQNPKGRFDPDRVVLVGDRGILTQTPREALKQTPGVGWISALRSHAIRELVEQGTDPDVAVRPYGSRRGHRCRVPRVTVHIILTNYSHARLTICILK